LILARRGGTLRRVAALAAAAVLVAGCATGTTPSPASAGASGPATAPGVSGSVAPSGSASASGSATAGTFSNPVIKRDFPDPFVLRVGDTYYAYATTDGAGKHLQMERSKDLVTWEELGDPLPKLPTWSTGDTWAPEVSKTSAGYVLYYTAHDSDLKRPDAGGSQCITLAVASSPEGPFVDSSKQPLVCQAAQGGSIDATPFVDANGKRYLIWKNDGNCCGLPTRFSIQELTPDGLKLVGKATDMGVVNNEQWEGGVIEAPTLLLHDKTYYLFYSANGYDTDFYSVGYATSKTLMGPYKDAPENPILASAWNHSPTSEARGPGHQSIIADAKGQLWMVYHAWDKDAVGYSNGGERDVWMSRLTFVNGKPVVEAPKDTEPAP
jgi:beta-xylosidase